MSVDDAIPPDLTPDERAEIRRRFAKALLNLGLGILLPLIYFWAMIAWLDSGLDHAATSETISLTFAIGFFPIIGIGLYLLLEGMADCLIYAYYRRHPEAFRDRRADHRLWLLTPPRQDWPRKFDEEAQAGKVVNRPLRWVYANTEWRYIEEHLTKARNRIRMHLRILTGYVAVLVIWSLDLTAPLRAEEAVFGVFLILAVFVPLVVMALLFEAFRNLRRFTIYQKEHFELLQRHNRTSGRNN